MVTAMYGNPFESLGWPAIFGISATGTRTYMFNAMPVTLTASLWSFVDSSATSATFDAGLPTTINVGQTQLTTDGQMLTIDPTKPIEITFSPDQSTNLLFTARIDELVVNGTAVERQQIFSGVSTEHTFDLPSDLLASGHTYVIDAGCIQGGYTQAASGDLETFAFPFSSSQLDSGVFTVQ